MKIFFSLPFLKDSFGALMSSRKHFIYNCLLITVSLDFFCFIRVRFFACNKHRQFCIFCGMFGSFFFVSKEMMFLFSLNWIEISSVWGCSDKTRERMLLLDTWCISYLLVYNKLLQNFAAWSNKHYHSFYGSGSQE